MCFFFLMICVVSLYSLSGLAWSKQRQANFINVLKFHSGVPLSPLCCVLELSEFPRSTYLWQKQLCLGVLWNQVSELPCSRIFLEGRLTCNGFGFLFCFVFALFIFVPPHSLRWGILTVESSLKFGTLAHKSVFRTADPFHLRIQKVNTGKMDLVTSQ